MKIENAATGLTEILMGLKKQQQRPENAVNETVLSGQSLPISSPIDPADHINVGSFYEIDHSKLPHKFPDQLNSVRIVMVNEKTRMRVSLRFPSVYSLRTYFNESNCSKSDGKKLPALDEKYTIGAESAAEALYRRIQPHEITDKRKLWHFWAVASMLPSNSRSRNTFVSKKGSLWSELKGTGIVKWGQRRQVRYLARHVENKRDVVVTCNVVREEKEAEEEEKEEEEEEENASMVVPDEGEGDQKETEESDGDEEDADVKADKSPETKRNRKRKHNGPNYKTQKKIKRPKREKKNQAVVYKQKKNKVLKNSIDRWSAERYKLAEVNMLKIMKEQGAVFGKPILRPELRTQARRLIGDTGLLDHLLKHMAGKVAPGGEERFRRRHNAEGAMEYWLEKADLVDIRREAGVQDPYWTPPTGWKPGDNPSQNPICAREIKELKEQIAKMERNIEELVSKKREEELAAVTTPISSVTSHSIEHDTLLTPLKEMYIDLVNKKAKIEELLMEISQSLCEMEEEMGKQKSTTEEANRTESFERPAIKGLPESTQQTGEEHGKAGGGNKTPPTTKSAVQTEDKAAKIERLKSGFRICKPQGTFLWPNMAISSPNHVMVQFEDLFSVPTPPSVSSTSASKTHLPSAPSQHNGPVPTSPVKPLAEKRPVKIALSKSLSLPIPSPHEIYSAQYEPSSIGTTSAISTTTTKTTLINLNELPSNQHDNGFSPGQTTSTYPVTYQRRSHHSVTTTSATATPCFIPANKDTSDWEGDDHQGKEVIRYCEQQHKGCCSFKSSGLSVGVGSWLAIATSKQSSENKSKRG